jgi:hypothetical protein
VPAEFLNFSHIPVGCIQRRRYRAVPDAVRRHLLFDASIFAVPDNDFANAVPSQTMPRVGKVEGREQRGIMRLVRAPSFQPIGDRLHRSSPQVHYFRLSAAPLAENPQSPSHWVKVCYVQLTDFVAPQSITPQQSEQSIVALADSSGLPNEPGVRLDRSRHQKN